MEMALYQLDLKADDEVIVLAYTYTAPLKNNFIQQPDGAARTGPTNKQAQNQVYLSFAL